MHRSRCNVSLRAASVRRLRQLHHLAMTVSAGLLCRRTPIARPSRMRLRISAPTTPEHRRSPMHRVGALVSAVFCMLAGPFALYIAISGERIAGGLPMIPDAWNQLLGRLMFAAGGVVTLCIAVLASRDARAPRRDGAPDSIESEAD